MADKLPFIQFYPGDWLRDGISGCSLAAQGLWLRMMIVAHDSDRYGYLETNGSPMQAETIARRCGVTLPEYETLLSELVHAGVPSTSDNGSLFSRRMARDGSLRAVRAKAGRKGGKQSAKQKRSKRQANTQQNPEDENEDEVAFESFWNVFPSGRRKSKGDAREAFRKALKKTDLGTLIESAKEYANSNEGRGQFVKMPSTWLNQECWNDDRKAWDRSESGKSGGWAITAGQRFRG